MPTMRMTVAAVMVGVAALATMAAWPATWPPARAGDADEPARGGMKMENRVTKSNEQWREELTPEQYRVTRCGGTEAPFSGKYAACKKDGVYRCVCCGAVLFDSRAKFDSGTGWPSFFQPHGDDAVAEKTDRSHGMVRTEVTCSRCGAHLGHVFEDGPRPTGLRYCINSASLDLDEDRQEMNRREQAIFGAGCFWGVEAAFAKVPGVLDTDVGYSGGHAENPTYKQVCTGRTGHAEVVRVTYDPARVSYEHLLGEFWRIHDPTTPNRQGPDRGTQYRSAIFATTTAQVEAAERSKKRLAASGAHDNPVVTEIRRAGPFYRAEDYHQDYFKKHGGPACH